MSSTRQVFFSTPEEQRDWLRSLLANKNLWCVTDVFESEWNSVTEPMIDEFTFHGSTRDDWKIYVGHRDLANAPVWRLTPHGKKDIDFTRSMAAEFAGSVVAGDDILLEGQLAIMRTGYYEDAGIDPKPVQQWYRSVARSLIDLGAKDAVLIQHTTLGTTKEWRDCVVTPGAVEWRSSGKHLKQFPDGPVEFDIRSEVS